MKKEFRILVFLLIVSFPNLLKGQWNYKPGFLVTNQNDTLHGFINDGGSLRNSTLCVFKTEKKASPTKYTPDEILSYGFEKGNIYQTKELSFKGSYRKVFTDVLIKGDVSLFEFSRNREMRFILQKKDEESVVLLNQKVNLPVSAESLYGLMNSDRYSPANSDRIDNQANSSFYLDVYKDSIVRLFRDDENILDQIDGVKYTRKSIYKITKDYITNNCKEENCIQYEKNLRANKPGFGIYSGIRMSQMTFLENIITTGADKELVNSKFKSDLYYSFPVGVYFNYPLTIVSDRLSFQAELLMNFMDYKNVFEISPDSFINVGVKSASLGIPIMLKYTFPMNRFFPFMALGKESSLVLNSDAVYGVNQDLMVLRYQKGGWFFDIGGDYKISPRLSVFAKLRLQSNYNMIIDGDFYNRVSYKLIYDYENYINRYLTRSASLYFGIGF
ncbi:MAG: hypothetical protein H6540_02860 [Bacteroidales bacterium]|nr:hypothetical protein [Bacteroidales bacterium]